MNRSMPLRKAAIFLCLVLLAVFLVALLKEGWLGRFLGWRENKYVDRVYTVYFVWESGLKNLRIVDFRTNSEEVDPKLRSIALTEAAPIVAEIVSRAQLKTAQGHFNLWLKGYGKPYLVEWHDAEITQPDVSLLMTAAMVWNLGAMEEVLATGIDVNARDLGSQKTALMWAAPNPDPSVVKLLLEAGADPNAKDAEGQTALMWASNATAKLLLAAGADVNAKDNDGRTALIRAIRQVEKKGPALAETLIKAGADVNSRDKFGLTPLMYAADRGDVEIVKLLLQAGADAKAEDKNGRSVLQLVTGRKQLSRQHKQIIELLKKAGAAE